MGRIGLAIRVFFAVLFRRQIAEAVAAVLSGPRPARQGPSPEPSAPSAPRPARSPLPTRSDAITLLATLQREARFVDFICEPLAGYSDAQIGAVAREVHRDCGSVIERLFGLVPVVKQPEGSELEVAAGFDSGRLRLTGNVAGQPPYRGRLVHPGWEATRCELPAWSGTPASARVIAPAEVELP